MCVCVRVYVCVCFCLCVSVCVTAQRPPSTLLPDDARRQLAGATNYFQTRKLNVIVLRYMNVVRQAATDALVLLLLHPFGQEAAAH